jgi:hypothetical protein
MYFNSFQQQHLVVVVVVLVGFMQNAANNASFPIHAQSET